MSKVGQSSGHVGVVGDSGIGDEQSGDSGDVGLLVGQSGGVESRDGDAARESRSYRVLSCGSSEDPDQRRAELVAEYEYLENPFLTAERFGIQDIIDPVRTRPVLAAWIARAYRLLPELTGPAARTMRP